MSVLHRLYPDLGCLLEKQINGSQDLAKISHGSFKSWVKLGMILFRYMRVFLASEALDDRVTGEASESVERP